MPSTEKQTFHLGCPILGVKRASISGDWMSACSHKRKFVVFDRWLLVIANSRPIPVRALAKYCSETVNFDSSNHNLVCPMIQSCGNRTLGSSPRSEVGSRRERPLRAVSGTDRDVT